MSRGAVGLQLPAQLADVDFERVRQRRRTAPARPARTGGCATAPRRGGAGRTAAAPARGPSGPAACPPARPGWRRGRGRRRGAATRSRRGRAAGEAAPARGRAVPRRRTACTGSRRPRRSAPRPAGRRRRARSGTAPGWSCPTARNWRRRVSPSGPGSHQSRMTRSQVDVDRAWPPACAVARPARRGTPPRAGPARRTRRSRHRPRPTGCGTTRATPPSSDTHSRHAEAGQGLNHTPPS